MAIVIPSIPQLNLRDLAFLTQESIAWTAKVKTLTGADRIAAQTYLDAVNAEKAQREAQYSGGFFSTVWAGLSAPFEALGGSAGAGAQGLGASTVQTVSDVGSSVGSAVTSGANRVLIVAAVVVVILGGFWLYLTKGK